MSDPCGATTIDQGAYKVRCQRMKGHEAAHRGRGRSCLIQWPQTEAERSAKAAFDVSRLRALAKMGFSTQHGASPVLLEAADEIDRLRVENATMKAQLDWLEENG